MEFPLIVVGLFLILICIFLQVRQKAHDKVFFLLCILAIGAFYYYHAHAKTNWTNHKNNNKPSNQLYKRDKPIEIPTNHYQVYKTPSSFKYSMRVPEYNRIIKSLSFVYKYDEEKLDRIKTYCEAFFKTHFNIMIGKYDPQLYIDELNDFKELAISTLNELVYVIPKSSTIVDIPDMDEYIYHRILLLTGVMNRYIKIIHKARKIPKENKAIEPPYESNIAL